MGKHAWSQGIGSLSGGTPNKWGIKPAEPVGGFQNPKKSFSHHFHSLGSNLFFDPIKRGATT